jgi:hypothetical protein
MRKKNGVNSATGENLFSSRLRGTGRRLYSHVFGRAMPDHAGACPYRATRCEKRVEMCHYTKASSTEILSIRPRSGSNPRSNVYFGKQYAEALPGSSMHRPAAEANGQYRKDQNTPGDLLPVEVPTDQ